MRYFWLNFHVNYACRHSGACCSAGWPIPVERGRVNGIQARLDRGDVGEVVEHWLVPAVGAPEEVAGMLALQGSGQCVFFRTPTSNAFGCSVHPARPLSCSHFPYVCVIDQRGVHVTLSHYCPTAAAMLFDHDGPIEIVEGPAPPTGLDIPEGLDAREALPPLASPDRLMSLDQFSAWEQSAVGTVGAYGAYGALGAYGTVSRRFERARAAVPPHCQWPEAPLQVESLGARLVEPAWRTFEPVIARYLAARMFASWATYLDDDGAAAVLRSVEIAAAVLQVEAARQCARADRTLDAGLLKAAIRQSDLLLVHYADTRVLSSADPS